MNKLAYTFLILSFMTTGFYLLYPSPVDTAVSFVKLKTSSKYTINDRLEAFGSSVRTRLLPDFQEAKVPLPPQAISLLAFKDTKRLELYAQDNQGLWKQVKVYPIQAASGNLGPKLREGDRQVPEGVYAIELLNPNSLYHVSLRLNYPNAYDRQMGALEGREQLGSDIMIHGKNVSIGCLAMGDVAAEELFALAAWVGIEHMKVVIAPTDFRLNRQLTMEKGLPVWTRALYANLRAELSLYEPTPVSVN